MLSLLAFINESKQKDRKASKRHNGKRSKAEEREYAKDSKFNFKFKSRGWKFDPSTHASAQAKDRLPQWTKDDWKKLHRNVAAAVERRDKGGDFVFFSRSLQQAYVAKVTPNQKKVRIITVLPKGHKKPKPGTKLMIIESEEYGMEDIYFDDVIDID